MKLSKLVFVEVKFDKVILSPICSVLVAFYFRNFDSFVKKVRQARGKSIK
jgi:hypothetical protein